MRLLSLHLAYCIVSAVDHGNAGSGTCDTDDHTCQEAAVEAVEPPGLRFAMGDVVLANMGRGQGDPYAGLPVAKFTLARHRVENDWGFAQVCTGTDYAQLTAPAFNRL